jgi:hypothetical protein
LRHSIADAGLGVRLPHCLRYIVVRARSWLPGARAERSLRGSERDAQWL